MTRVAGTLLLLLIFSVGVDVRASITAASCNAGDVQAALNQAAPGDTVNIPSGTCNWTTGVSWNAPPDVTLRGAGDLSVSGGGNYTVIIDDLASNGALLNITTNGAGRFRLAGISFRGGSSGSHLKEGGVVRISGSSHQVRVDHVYFNMRSYTPNNVTNAALRFFGWVYGVVDHSVWDLNGIGHALKYEHSTYGNLSNGDGAWAASTRFGSDEFIFAEDNTFNGNANDAAINDCNAGGRWVVRYNTSNGAQLQTHPTGGAGRGRGCRASEVYGNMFTSAAVPLQTPPFNVFYLSSGASLIWGNTVDASFKNFVTLHAMRRNNRTYPQWPNPDGWGYCGTSFNGTGSNWDGNTNATTGYPCLDQPGRGQSDLLSGDFPNVRNTTLGCTSSSPCWPRQALEPVREWLNTFTPAPGWGGSFWAPYEEVIAANRDYYLHTGSFNGTSGNGSGPRSSRPSTCTVGVGYWVTDQGGNWNATNSTENDGTLDVCTATNTWTSGVYRPYPYPHPLTQTSGPSMPARPTNLRVLG